jgi:subtilisin family serine protease
MPFKLSRFLVAGLALSFAIVLPSSVQRATRADSGDYYYNAGRRVAIERSRTRVAFRLPASASKTDVVGRIAGTPGVRATRDVGSGVLEVTLDGAASKAPTADLEAVAAAADGELLPVYYEPGVERDASTLFVRDAVLARFRPDVSTDEVAMLGERLGFDVAEPLRYASNGFRLVVRGGGLDRNALTVANAVVESGLADWAHPDFLAHRSLRHTPNDPQFVSQWHLANTGQGGGSVGADVEAEAAWDVTTGDASISVAVADTGIDYTHEDFAVTVGGLPKVHDPRDVVHDDDDPSPKASDADGRHGTSASGVAVAAIDNGLDTTGIAPGCRLVPIQLYAESTFTPNATEADAFTWAADHADVMSNSWGPDNDDTPLPDATRAAIEYATTHGRGGKGLVIFFAAGNSNDDTVHDNYVSSPNVVAVAASTNFDVRAPYSRFGAAVSVCAPSSGGSLGITTTDVTGQPGYSSLNYTSTFGGTSSACPLAAGIAALVLSVNPGLTWQEVRGVLEQSADKIDAANGGYDASGRSDLYGYGRVNARAAVELARDLLDPTAPRVTLDPVSGRVGAGGPAALAWTTGGTLAIASQELEYSTDRASFVPIAAPAAIDRTFVWTIPGELAGAVSVRITVVNTAGATASATIALEVLARPAISGVKLAASSTGKRSLVVDGSAFLQDEAVIYVGDTALGAIKFPKGRRNDDGTARRIVSKDARVTQLIRPGSPVTITVRHTATGQVSAPFTFTR